MKCDFCKKTDEQETDYIYTVAGTVLGEKVYLCDDCLEAKKPEMQDGKVGEAGAIFAFMGWLTSRDGVSGPFSARHEASEAAQLAARFCESQGWAIIDDHWFRHTKPYPDGYTPSAKIENDAVLDIEPFKQLLKDFDAYTSMVTPRSARAKRLRDRARTLLGEEKVDATNPNPDPAH